MSRYYEMTVEVSDHDPARVPQIQVAAEKEWPFTDWWSSGDGDDSAANMQASAQHSLCGGESEEQFSERLSMAIWQANGGFCRVSVDATFLENLPYQTYAPDEADYARLIRGKTRSKSRRKRQ
jgi:hypothetical protein